MGKSDGIKAKIMNDVTPSDIKKKELLSFLEREGFILKRIKGDHYIFDYPLQDGTTKTFVIPMADPVKRPYIKQIRDAIRQNEE